MQRAVSSPRHSRQAGQLMPPVKSSTLILLLASACLADAETFDPNRPINPASWYNDQYPGQPLGADRTRRPWDDPNYQTNNRGWPRWFLTTPICFPPYPAPLGEAVAVPLVRPEIERNPPPDGLEQDVYETFSAPLSILLVRSRPAPKLLERLRQYRADRARLLTELRARLAASSPDAAARAREFAAFAATQAPALSALETEAEQLRAEFSRQIGGRFWRNPTVGVAWYGVDTASKALRNDAAFQNGLSTDQRLLLREFEMAVALRQNRSIPATRPGPILLFSPATAGLRLPGDFPAELIARLNAFVTEKNALLQELRATLEAEDARFFESSRVRTLRALAEKQAPRFAALEQLAEEIRRGLVRLPAESPPAPAAPPLGENFRDYRFAVLEPGLSPTQRRLLFGAALTQLDVPFNL